MNGEHIESELNSHGCSKKNKISACIAISTSVLIISLLLIAFIFVYFYALPQEHPVCPTSSCQEAANEITEAIDDSINPCDDFYTFVCGKSIKTPKSIVHNPLKEKYDKIQEEIIKFITEPKSNDDSGAVKLQKMYFQSCINTTAIDLDKDEYLLDQLSRIGSWPLLKRGEWRENKFDWIKVMGAARRLGLPFEWFLKIDLYYDENREEYALKLTHPENCGYDLSEEYFAMQRDILEQFTKPGINTIAEFNHLEKFEKKLNSVCAEVNESFMSLRNASDLWVGSNKQPLDFISSITGVKGWKYTSKIVYSPSYFFELNHLLRQNSKEVQATYVLWKIIEHYAPYLSKPIRERYAEYLEEISETNTTRTEFCIEDTKKKFKHLSEITYLQQKIDADTQTAGKQFLQTIKNEFFDSFENDTARKSYSDFYDDLEEVIVGPEEMFEDDFIDEHVHQRQLFFFSKNIIQMLTSWSQATLNNKMKMIGQEFESWETVEALPEYSIILDEQLALPTLAFYSFFSNDPEVPQYLNYGNFGPNIGTEFVRTYNQLTGNHLFEKNRKCLIDNLKNSIRRLNATTFYNENYDIIAGQNLAYRTHQKFLEEADEADRRLPGLDYTPNQLFWMKSALNWCYQTINNKENSFKSHQILKYKIFEAVKNSEFFAKDFNCPSDAPMNPENKCQLF